ncbi:hypothetical protein P8452_66868 [Trifolium repens]|nr:hypothetical protein P8452_66868 [Trifolium repens]
MKKSLNGPLCSPAQSNNGPVSLKEVLKFKHILQHKIPFNLSLSLLPLYTQIFGFHFSLSFDINPTGENDEADNTDEAKRLLLMGLRKKVHGQGSQIRGLIEFTNWGLVDAERLENKYNATQNGYVHKRFQRLQRWIIWEQD